MAIRTIDDTSLTNIANAIREKTHETGMMYPGEMANKIANITTGEPDWLELGYTGAPASILAGFEYAQDIMENWNSSTTNRSRAFQNDYNLILFPSVNMMNVTNTEYMFNGCKKLIYIPENLDLSHVTNAKDFASNATALDDITLTGLGEGLQRTINCQSLAQGCTGLHSAEIDCRYVTNIYNIFNSCNNLNSVILSNTGNIQNAAQAFVDCKYLEGFDFTPDWSSVTDAASMFSGCIRWKQNIDWSYPECTNFSNAFAYIGMTPNDEEDNGIHIKLNAPKAIYMDAICKEDTGDPLHKALVSANFTTSNTLKTLGRAFNDCIKMVSCTISNTSKVGDGDWNGWYATFRGCSNLETISTLDMSYAQTLEETFKGCSKLTALTTTGTVGDNQGSNAGLGKATNAFNGCTLLESVPVFSFIRVSDGNFLNDMFLGCINLTDAAINNILLSCTTVHANFPAANKTLYRLGFRSTWAPETRFIDGGVVNPNLTNWDAFVAAGWSLGYPT